MKTHAAFQNNLVSILDKHAPKKTTILRGNQYPHFNTFLPNQIMIRSRLKTKQISQKILVALSILSDNETWWQILINKSNYTALRHLVLIVISNHFGKHVNRTSQMKTVIYKKIQCCLKRINFDQNKKIPFQLSITISEQSETR